MGGQGQEEGNNNNTLQVLVAVLTEQYSGIKETLARIEGLMGTQGTAQVELDKRVIVLEMGAKSHERMMARLWTFASGLGIGVVGLVIKDIFF